MALTDEHHGYRATCPRVLLMQAIKFGTTSSPADVVELLFGEGTVEVAGLSTDGQRTSQGTIQAPGASDPVRIVIRGRKVWDLLNTLDDDEVDVGYTSPTHPLRLESSGGYVSAVWPLRGTP
jgi:hypothetical protein